MKAIWIKQIKSHRAEYLTRKQLAAILDVSTSKIDYDIHITATLKVVKLGTDGSRAEVRIPKENAIDYVMNFFC